MDDPTLQPSGHWKFESILLLQLPVPGRNPPAIMSAGIGDAMQIIDIIQKVRRIYLRIQGTGKEIDDAFEDVEIMETELRFLQKTFSPKKAGGYPEM
jgi:hypothetical protein